MNFFLHTDNVQIAMPSVCIMEAWSAFEAEQRRRMRFVNELGPAITEARRDLTFVHARSLVSSHEISRLESLNILDDVQARLRDILTTIARPRQRRLVNLKIFANCCLIPASQSLLPTRSSSSASFDHNRPDRTIRTHNR
jgi:hypothetical protein